MATKTTIIVPRPIEVKTVLPANSIPAMAINTVPPEISTAWPDVPAACSSDTRGSLPFARSSRSRRR
jgi:hypothetical protein